MVSLKNLNSVSNKVKFLILCRSCINLNVTWTSVKNESFFFFVLTFRSVTVLIRFISVLISLFNWGAIPFTLGRVKVTFIDPNLFWGVKEILNYFSIHSNRVKKIKMKKYLFSLLFAFICYFINLSKFNLKFFDLKLKYFEKKEKNSKLKKSRFLQFLLFSYYYSYYFLKAFKK